MGFNSGFKGLKYVFSFQASPQE